MEIVESIIRIIENNLTAGRFLVKREEENGVRCGILQQPGFFHASSGNIGLLFTLREGCFSGILLIYFKLTGQIKKIGGRMIMAEKVPVYVFSGTGNTLMVAQEFERQAAGFDMDVEIRGLSFADKENGRNPGDPAESLIGLFYPVYGFGAPRIVTDWVKRLPRGDGRRFFLMLSAAGGEKAVNVGAANSIARLLIRKGFEVPYVRILRAGSNWLVRFPDDFTRELIRVLPEKCADAARAITAGEKRSLPRKPVLHALTAFMAHHEDSFGARFWGRLLKTSDVCNGCGLCVQRCPMGNIAKNDSGGIVFGWNCQWCMRCVYSCPKKAIVPRFFKSAVLKDGYDPKAIFAASDTGEPRVQLEKMREENKEYLENAAM